MHFFLTVALHCAVLCCALCCGMCCAMLHCVLYCATPVLRDVLDVLCAALCNLHPVPCAAVARRCALRCQWLVEGDGRFLFACLGLCLSSGLVCGCDHCGV